MKEMDLMKAIGNVSEDYLQELEAPVRHNRGRGMVWKVALAAAIVSLFTMTAIAAPVIRSKLQGAEVTYKNKEEWFPYISVCGYDTGTMTSGYDVQLNIEANPDAPPRLENAYIPQVLLENYRPTRCAKHVCGIEYWCKYVDSDGTITDIRFEQYVIPPNGNGTYRAVCRGIDGVKAQTQMVSLEDNPVLEVVFQDDDTPGGGNRQLYWSDGMYIYYLMVAYDVPAEFYESVITSVQLVENIDDYLFNDEHPPKYSPNESENQCPNTPITGG